MEVQPDHIVVLADAAERAEEIDVERAEAARRRAEEFLGRAKEEEDFARAEAALRRSIIRLKVAERRHRGRQQLGGPGGGMPSS
jgi:F-type H+-transporting ATPase subunit epsilon